MAIRRNLCVVRRRPNSDERRLASWTGTGYVEVDPSAPERAGVLGTTWIVLMCVAVDLVALAVTILLTQRDNLIVCGRLCFANPRATIHDEIVTLWAFGTATIGAAVLSLAFRLARVAVLVLQALVALFVLLHTLPGLSTAQHRNDVLNRCSYGYTSPCTGVANLGPP